MFEFVTGNMNPNLFSLVLGFLFSFLWLQIRATCFTASQKLRSIVSGKNAKNRLCSHATDTPDVDGSHRFDGSERTTR